MYEDEGMQNIKQGVNGIYRFSKEAFRIYKMLKGYNDKNTLNGLSSLINKFVLTGKHTDLGFFLKEPIMTKAVLDNLSFELKNKVIDNLIRAEKNGYLDVDVEKGTIKLSESGLKYVNSPNFINQMTIDQNSINLANTETKLLGVELNGTMNDLNAFSVSSKLDLKQLLSSPEDGNAFNKVLANFVDMKEKGLINIELKTGIASLTDKGLATLNSSAFKLAAGKTAEKAVAAVPAVGQVVVITKKVVSVVKKAIEATKTQGNAL